MPPGDTLDARARMCACMRVCVSMTYQQAGPFGKIPLRKYRRINTEMVVESQRRSLLRRRGCELKETQ